LRMEAILSSETSGSLQTTRRYAKESVLWTIALFIVRGYCQTNLRVQFIKPFVLVHLVCLPSELIYIYEIYKYIYFVGGWPPLWSSDQSSLLQI
jgi:hypothetical protein